MKIEEELEGDGQQVILVEKRQTLEKALLTQEEKEFLDCNYYVQVQNFQNNRGRAQNVNNNLTIECVIKGCDKRFQKCSKLRQHLKCHLSVRFYECSYPDCGKSFKMP